jgi:hypothetical protein
MKSIRRAVKSIKEAWRVPDFHFETSKFTVIPPSAPLRGSPSMRLQLKEFKRGFDMRELLNEESEESEKEHL